jgi:ligand-binding sensor domain-containing protein
MTVHRFGKWIRLLADHSGIIWFGTDKGLSKLVPNPFTGFTMDD